MIFGGRIFGHQRAELQNGTPLHREMRSRGYVLKQNTLFRAIVKRDTPPGWTAVLTEGVTIRSPPCKGVPYVVKLGSGAVDLPTDGKSPAQGYGETP